MSAVRPTLQFVALDASDEAPETFSVSAEIECVELDGVRKPPTEIRILKSGINETTKGRVVCNAAAARATIEAVVAHYGKPELNFDYGHGQVGIVASYESARSAGWFKLSERNGELWATDIQWTPTAAKALADREFRYFSPTLFRNVETGEIRNLVNVALTNIPATKGQKPLVASQTPSNPEPRTVDPELKKALDKLGLTSLDALVKAAESVPTLLAATSQVQAELTEARAKLDAVEAERAKASKAELVTKLSQEGKLPPALREWALDQDVAVLQAYAAKAPVVAAAAPAVAAPESKPEAEKALELSADEIKVCEQMMLSQEDYLATKRALMSSGKFSWSFDPVANAPAKESK